MKTNFKTILLAVALTALGIGQASAASHKTALCVSQSTPNIIVPTAIPGTESFTKFVCEGVSESMPLNELTQDGWHVVAMTSDGGDGNLFIVLAK